MLLRRLLLSDSAPVRPREWALAAFVCFHIVAVLIGTVPSPHALTRRSTLEDDQFAPAVHRAKEIAGFQGSDQAWVDHVIAVSRQAVQVEKKVLAPFRPYYRWAGTKQSWTMFSVIDRRPGELVITVDDQEVYRSGPGGWREDFWGRSRVTGLVATWIRGAGPPKSYRQMIDHVTPWVAQDFPDAEQVTFCIHRRPVAPPGEPRPEGRCKNVQTRPLR